MHLGDRVRYSLLLVILAASYTAVLIVGALGTSIHNLVHLWVRRNPAVLLIFWHCVGILLHFCSCCLPT